MRRLTSPVRAQPHPEPVRRIRHGHSQRRIGLPVVREPLPAELHESFDEGDDPMKVIRATVATAGFTSGTAIEVIRSSEAPSIRALVVHIASVLELVLGVPWSHG